MSASLVGSEMCIRDSPSLNPALPPWPPNNPTHAHPFNPLPTPPTNTAIDYTLPIPPPPPLTPTVTP
eukprot:12659938-Alexandrium_andersonii.AAC.1